MFERDRIEAMSERALRRALRGLEGVYYETGDEGFPEELRADVSAIRAELARRASLASQGAARR